MCVCLFVLVNIGPLSFDNKFTAKDPINHKTVYKEKKNTPDVKKDKPDVKKDKPDVKKDKEGTDKDRDKDKEKDRDKDKAKQQRGGDKKKKKKKKLSKEKMKKKKKKLKLKPSSGHKRHRTYSSDGSSAGGKNFHVSVSMKLQSRKFQMNKFILLSYVECQ